MSMPVFWEFDGICGAGVSETWMIDCTWFQTKQPPKSTLFAGPTVRGFNLEVSKISAAQSFLKIGYPSSSSGLKLYFPYSNLHDLGVIPPSPHFGTSQIYWLFHIYIDIYIYIYWLIYIYIHVYIYIPNYIHIINTNVYINIYPHRNPHVLLASHLPFPPGTARETKRLDGVTRAPLYSAMGDVADGLATLRAHQQWPDVFCVGMGEKHAVLLFGGGFFGWVMVILTGVDWILQICMWIYQIYLHFWTCVGWFSIVFGGTRYPIPAFENWFINFGIKMVL